LWPCGGPTLEQSVPEGPHTVEKNPYWSSSWRMSACGKHSYRRSSSRTGTGGRDPTLEQGRSV